MWGGGFSVLRICVCGVVGVGGRAGVCLARLLSGKYIIVYMTLLCVDVHLLWFVEKLTTMVLQQRYVILRPRKLV